MSPQLTAVVEAPDGVRFVHSAEQPEEIVERLAKYVSDRCEWVLWPAAATQVRALIENHESSAAIALYFEEVGDRWDDEWLALAGFKLATPDRSPTPTSRSADVTVRVQRLAFS